MVPMPIPFFASRSLPFRRVGEGSPLIWTDRPMFISCVSASPSSLITPSEIPLGKAYFLSAQLDISDDFYEMLSVNLSVNSAMDFSVNHLARGLSFY